MAEAALLALLKVACDRLASLILEEFCLFNGLHKDIANLSSTLSIILGVLEDAEEKQVKDKGVKNWLKNLENAAYEADDILDQCTTEALRRKMEIQGRLTKQVRNFFSVSNPVAFDLHMAHKIKKIRERFDVVAEERFKFHLREGIRSYETKGREKTDSFIIESDVYGRNEDKERIIELLFDEGDEGEVPVITVVGMAGLGKTALAQLVYNDTRVEGHFHLRIWVCVSDDFDVQRLTKAILNSASGKKCDFEDVDMLQRRLREKLSGRKFLLVLDDVWDENPNNWERLMSYLRAGATGSKVIVTTRSERVASIMGTLPPHYLGGLSDEDCWLLFKQRAFGRGREENPNLVVLGKEIVKKCGGIPLAAKALGSLMRFKKEERQWEFIKENEIWNLPEEENDILPALRLSYYQLPSQLKQCFAYCSIFPKDSLIKTKELIRLWIAEGFIQPTQGSEPVEDIGRDYFNNLLWRSFFQEPVKDDDENVVSCKMHDLMHDLAASVSGDSCVIVKKGNLNSIPNGCRHLSLVRSFVECPSMDLMASRTREKLRTLLTLPDRTAEILSMFPPSMSILSHKISTRLSCLRVLDLSSADVTKDMLNSISQLKQLRYLHLSHVEFLPESFSKLHNLQTLRLTSCWNLSELPREMRRMTNLRHLEITHFDSFTHMPAKIGELKFLQTLSVFIIGRENGHNIIELQELKLSGELNIRKLENVRGRKNAVEAKLNEKASLRSLTFSWSHVNMRVHRDSEQTLEGLQPHRNLKCLTVENYGGERFPYWMSDCSLPHLTKVSLSNCRECKQLPLLGQLAWLKFLYIAGMDALKCIGCDFFGDRAFPSLEDLTFENMPNLEEWSVSNHNETLPRLQKVRLSRCPKLAVIPYLPSLSLLMIYNFEGQSLPVDLFQNQTHLSTLIIMDCPNLESLSGELRNLAALQGLRIEGCDSLTSLRLQGCFRSLRGLVIKDCDGLVSLVVEMHHLTALEWLRIDGCPELGSLPEGMEHLASLVSLYILHCHRLMCLPEGLKYAPILQHLFIHNLPNLTALPEWIWDIASLQSLTIVNCRNLVSLPSGLQHLTNLPNPWKLVCQLELNAQMPQHAHYYFMDLPQCAHHVNLNFILADKTLVHFCCDVLEHGKLVDVLTFGELK
ncbi:hypothetical protein ACLOJK_024723 [Asimina triloba]